ncbi:hypothetical protein NQ317_009333 [Molorchus minor]|uniref:Protein KRI1 homolog n=1 Tax=Molorchus minor TaxID=1323400 RepID=A0ABQ9JIG7_9CUCU|nr:hypothetical protein NQ317_009333 [Molorchus minor]
MIYEYERCLHFFDEDLDLDSDDIIKTNNEYAKKYNVWRNKEELNKLKTKYGEEIDINEESSSSSDDEEGIELTEKIEKEFYKTLACLKNKDPRIYDENVNFLIKMKMKFLPSRKLKKKDEPMYLKDYERNLILERGGVLSDEDEDVEKRPRLIFYNYCISNIVEEQKNIKEDIKKALSNINEDEDVGEWGGLFKERKKTKEEEKEEDVDYKKWLIGHTKEITNKEVETELKPLKDYWNNPNLDKGEKFLRDYILNKKSQTKNLLKGTPTTMENSLRRKDDRRKVKKARSKGKKAERERRKNEGVKEIAGT